MGQNSFPRAHRTSKERVERFTDKEGEARLGQAGLRIYPRRACSRVHARAAYTNGSAAPRRAALPCRLSFVGRDCGPGTTLLFVSGRLTIASVGCNAPEACNGLKMSKVWASGLLTILLFATSLVSSFNLEVRYPIIKVGRGQAYFGYSVAQHRTLRTREFGEAVILVGAPKDDNLQPNTTESGALWQCPLSTEWQVCGHFFSDLRPTTQKIAMYLCSGVALLMDLVHC